MSGLYNSFGSLLLSNRIINVIFPVGGAQQPVLGENMCYIVAVVIIDDEGRVLMMQEAKRLGTDDAGGEEVSDGGGKEVVNILLPEAQPDR